MNPIEYREISLIMAKSGTIIAAALNSIFKLSGSSCRPAHLKIRIVNLLSPIVHAYPSFLFSQYKLHYIL